MVPNTFSSNAKWRKRPLIQRIAHGPIARGALDGNDEHLASLTDFFFMTGTGYAQAQAAEWVEKSSTPKEWRSILGEQLCKFYEGVHWHGYSCPQCLALI